MILPSFSDFSQLCDRGNFIPVYQELVADMDTPVAAWYRVCAGQPFSFLLESVEGGERVGRYSLLGCDPLWRLEARGDRTIQTGRDGTTKTHIGNPLEYLSACLEPIQPIKLPDLPIDLPTGGLIGFWGYELIKWIEPRVPVYACNADDVPDGLWMQVDSLLVFDQVKRKIWAIAYGDLRNNVDPKVAYDDACDRLALLVEKLRSPLDYQKTLLNWTDPKTQPPVNFSSNFTPEAFQAGVKQAKEHIKAGDIFQVVLSQRLSTEYTGDPFNLYRSLRMVNPSPYMAYLNFGDWQVIGSSPEVMVKADKIEAKTQATVRPIAGTRTRGATLTEDLALGEDLLNDPKEVSEHIMLVDLGRNDLGRVCKSGTVVVDELMSIERYSHVMHIVSNVVGELKTDKTAWDLLSACFPAGTVSGAPKIRAMEIIHNLESDRRGTYAGAYGYYDFEGQLNTAITIRTMIVKDGILSVQAGAGIVADSDPKMEYQETLNKAKGMLEAIRGLGIQKIQETEDKRE